MLSYLKSVAEWMMSFGEYLGLGWAFALCLLIIVSVMCTTMATTAIFTITSCNENRTTAQFLSRFIATLLIGSVITAHLSALLFFVINAYLLY